MKRSLVLFILFLCSCNYSARQPVSSNDTTTIAVHSSPSPLTRDTHNIFPSRMHITGKIVDYSPAVPCGRTCTSAHLKVQLSKEPGGYPRPYVFIAAPCFSRAANELLDRTISMEARKIAMDDSSCYFSNTSHIRANGITPWYQPGEYYVMEGDTVKW